MMNAQQIAQSAHRGRLDKGGRPYIDHPAAVAAAVVAAAKDAAWLHDVIEDTSWTLTMLRIYGIDEDTVLAVDLLTRREGEAYGDYIMRIINGPGRPGMIARVVKRADLKHNLDPARTYPGMGDQKRYHRALALLSQR